MDIQDVLLWMALCCVVPSLVVVAVSVYALYTGNKWLNQAVAPDTSQMQRDFEKLRAKHPKESTDELVRRIVGRQALRCGIIGAVTSVGGFFTIPIALPIDMVTTLRIQNAMVHFIAFAYGVKPNAVESQAINALVVSGGRQATEYMTRRIMAGITWRVAGKSFAKLIPLIGAFLGFAINYGMARTAGFAAAEVYRRQQLTG